jgi:uncharacterized membrane protein YgdD (TMEM256/DUF423 family)
VERETGEEVNGETIDAPRAPARGGSASVKEMDRFFFVAGASFALIAVAAGAFGAHFLSARLPVDRLGTFETGVRYQMYHALALLAFAVAWTRWPVALLQTAGWLLIAGILVFSGSLYALAFGAPRWFGAITPLGGLSFLAGWACAIIAVLRR